MNSQIAKYYSLVSAKGVGRKIFSREGEGNGKTRPKNNTIKPFSTLSALVDAHMVSALVHAPMVSALVDVPLGIGNRRRPHGMGNRTTLTSEVTSTTLTLTIFIC